MAFIFLQQRGPPLALTYADLHKAAIGFAAELRRDLRSGDNVVLAYPPGLDFIIAFFGCVLAGVRPAPAQMSLLPDGVRRIETIALAAEARAILAPSATLERLYSVSGTLSAAAPTVLALSPSTSAKETSVADEQPPRRGPDDPCFLQFSSGSTGAPKGVVVTHRNVISNLALLNSAFRISERDLAVSWLPHHHDMGLIAGILHSVYSGIPAVLMSPLAFLLRPDLWLTTISDFRATLSAGPDFAYAHCVKSIAEDARRGLDLSSWEVAISGSEPVRPQTLNTFADAFAPCGFDRRAFYPSYGLAEATLMVSGAHRGAGATLIPVDAVALSKGRILAPEDEAAAQILVGCGPPAAAVVIVKPGTTVRVAPGEVGEVLVSGPGVSPGYYSPGGGVRTSELVDELGEQPFLRTGDLGVEIAGELCIVGRLKDLIVVRGRNVHPADVESAVQSAEPAFRSGGGAAFGVDFGAGEELVMVQEVETGSEASLDRLTDLVATVREAALRSEGLEIDRIILVAPGQIPKTTSGKVRRQACRAQFLSNGLRELTRWIAAGDQASTRASSRAASLQVADAHE